MLLIIDNENGNLSKLRGKIYLTKDVNDAYVRGDYDGQGHNEAQSK